MAIYPAAEYRPLGEQTEDPMRAHNILCFHTIVGSLQSADDFFDNDGYYGVESHFGVGGSTDGAADGKVVQWQDTRFGADANLDGKPEVVSIETSDGGNPDREWSPKQLDALVKLGVWVCKTHDIPPVLIPDTQPGRRGIGYHRMGCDHGSSYVPKGWPYDKWREPGGVKWSLITGKTCPGNVRIKQLVDVVIPRIKAGVEGDAVSAAEVWTYRERETDADAIDYVKSSWGALKRLETDVDALRAEVEAVKATVAGLGQNPGGGATKAEVEAVVASANAPVIALLTELDFLKPNK